ncbi:MAG: hypothetical protein M0R48_05680 [Candidatus Omnitrophica bacterium]|nr:hypothetical protein [Candidatus Omnitrophota bacterium]
MIQIEIKDNKKVEFALEELKKTVHDNVFHHSLCSNILLFNVDIKGIKKIRERLNLLLVSISRFQKYTSHSIEDFKRAILEEIEARKGIKPEVFRFIFYLNIERSSIEKKRFFALRGSKLFSRTHSFIDRNFNLEKFIAESRLYVNVKIPPSPAMFQPFECIVSGRNDGEAFWKAFDIFELFRAILNFSNNFGVISVHFGSRHAYLNSFLPSPFCLVYNSKREYLHFRYDLIEYKYKTFNRTGAFFKPEVFRLLLKVFRDEIKEESIEVIILEALFHYVKALDSLEWETDFLKLWRILEVITFYSEESTIKLTGNRIKLLFHQTPKWNYVIDFLCSLRNELVHKGNFPEEGSDQVSALKFIVENAISILISMRKDFKDKAALRLFYENDSSGTGDLRKKISVIKKILAYRK